MTRHRTDGHSASVELRKAKDRGDAQKVSDTQLRLANIKQEIDRTAITSDDLDVLLQEERVLRLRLKTLSTEVRSHGKVMDEVRLPKLGNDNTHRNY